MYGAWYTRPYLDLLFLIVVIQAGYERAKFHGQTKSVDEEDGKVQLKVAGGREGCYQ